MIPEFPETVAANWYFAMRAEFPAERRHLTVVSFIYYGLSYPHCPLTDDDYADAREPEKCSPVVLPVCSLHGAPVASPSAAFACATPFVE